MPDGARRPDPPTPDPDVAPASVADALVADALVADPLIAGLGARCVFPPPGTAVECAVSGGADSLTLLVLACAAGLQVTAVHVDHGLRPDSAAEAGRVAAAARRFGARFRAETVTVEPGPDLEQRARLARRAVLAPDALTGHTADDQAETVLINLLRGAGPAGLAAMRPGPPHPMLALRRADTVGLCAHLGLDPLHDPSNDDPRFVRNRVRHELLPLMAAIADRDPVPLLCRTADHARVVVDDLDDLAAPVDPTDTRLLQAQPPSVARAALRAWLRDERGHHPSTAELERVMAVVRHERRSCELAAGRRVSRRDGILHLDHGPTGHGPGSGAADDEGPATGGPPAR